MRHRQSRRAKAGVKDMFRKTLFAAAAALMTVGGFSSTVWVMTAGSPAPAQVA
jgi:FtsP/CotA-like multicopper oxidase with cupredoxin domain